MTTQRDQLPLYSKCQVAILSSPLRRVYRKRRIHIIHEGVRSEARPSHPGIPASRKTHTYSRRRCTQRSRIKLYSRVSNSHHGTVYTSSISSWPQAKSVILGGVDTLSMADISCGGQTCVAGASTNSWSHPNLSGIRACAQPIDHLGSMGWQMRASVCVCVCA
jgi:hypothetical protein